MTLSPARWVRGVLTVFPSKDGSGHEGTLTIDGVVIHVRAWRKVSGHVEFEAQYQGDAEFEALSEALAGKVQG